MLPPENHVPPIDRISYNEEELRAEIDRGIAQLDAGEFTELDSDAKLQAFFDDIAARSIGD